MQDEAVRIREEFQNELTLRRTFDERVALFEEYRTAETKRWLPQKTMPDGMSFLDEFSRRFSGWVEFLLKEAFWWAFEQANIACCTTPAEANMKKEGALFWVLSPAAAAPTPGANILLFLIFRDASSGAEKIFLEKFYQQLAICYGRLLGAKAQDPALPPVLPFSVQSTVLPLSRFGAEFLAPETSTFARRTELLKFRPLAGSSSLIQAVMQGQADYVYSNRPVHFGDAARERILRQKMDGDAIFDIERNPGGLLDIEYLTVTLQIAYGRKLAGDVRSPETLSALYGLRQAGVLGEKNYQDLRAAYVFLTGLRQALKIRRADVFANAGLPEEMSPDFTATGRLLGYQGADKEVYVEFKLAYQHHMAAAERLYENTLVHLANVAWESIPGQVLITRESVRVRLDELLRGAPRPEDVPVLRRMGFLDIKALAPRFQALCPNMAAFEPFARALECAWELWPAIPNPDLALQHLELFMRNNEDPYRTWYALAKSEKGFRLLLHLFGTSRYLSGIFLKNRECWPWVEQTQFLSAAQSCETLESFSKKNLTADELSGIYQKEILRLALADLFMGEPLDELMRAHTRLALFLLTGLIKQIPGAEKVSVLGLGGLGAGSEDLGSEWDLHLIAAQETDLAPARRFLEMLTAGSSERALVRLKVYGHEFEGEHPALWLYETWRAQLEGIASLNKASRWLSAVCLVGPAELNQKVTAVLDELKGRMRSWMEPAALQKLIATRRAEEALLQSQHDEDRHLLLGGGMLQDLEWSVLAAWCRSPAVPVARPVNFLEMLKILEHEKIFSEKESGDMHDAYLDFKKALSRLRLLSNDAASVLPADQEEYRIFAKVMGFLDQGIDPAEERFKRYTNRLRERTRAVFQRVFREG